MERLQFFVVCSQCQSQHPVEDQFVEFENVEEDIHGRDVVTFTCRATNQRQQSLVFRGAT